MKPNPDLRRNIYRTAIIHAVVALVILLSFIYAVAYKAGG